TVFSKAKKAGKWVGENPVASTERRKVAKRIYATLRAEEVPLLLAEVPAEWRPLFAAALWTGMRRGELFALRKSDVDLSLGTIMVARSNERDTTKGGHADLIPTAAAPCGQRRARARCASTRCATRPRRCSCVPASTRTACNACCATATCARRPESTAT